MLPSKTIYMSNFACTYHSIALCFPFIVYKMSLENKTIMPLDLSKTATLFFYIKNYH